MTLFLDRIDAVPISYNDFKFEFNNWLSVLVDTLNEVLMDLEGAILSTEIITGTTQAAQLNSLYIASNAAPVVFQLPETIANNIGSRITIVGIGSGGWQVLTNVTQIPPQTIQIADVGATATTSVTSTSPFDSMELILAGTSTWTTLSAQTTGFVIV
jgi:hypothetical protein